MKLSEFDYFLPKERIAQHPLQKRDASRLLVLHRKSGHLEHRHFRDLPDMLSSGDALVLNDTKVKRARVIEKKPTGGKIEALFIRRLSPSEYEVLLNPASRLKLGSQIFFGDRAATLVGGNGTVKRIRFQERGIARWIARRGIVPLPPYIRRPPERKDISRYQTVYARHEGAVAAPTAGLHFTKGLLQKIKKKGIHCCAVTLHVGYGTFEPVRCKEIQHHRMHEESFELSSETCAALNRVRQHGGRIVAVGSTSCRVLETSVQRTAYSVQEAESSSFRAMRGWTELFIYPPYDFRGLDALLTNFHLPRSTLFMLVCAFAGMGLIRKAYQEAIDEGYRFYSYGDAMLIL